MRTVARDRKDVYIALQLPPIPLVTETGAVYGSVVQYDTPVKFTARVSRISDRGEIEIYGASSKSMKKIVESLANIAPSDVDYMSAVWIGCTPSEAAYDDPIEGETTTTIPEPLDFNYRVSATPIVTPRQIIIYLESVVPNA